MKKSLPVILFLLFAGITSAQSLSFVVQPSLTNVSGNWQVVFELNKAADVEVAIVDLQDTSVVRHLAGGMLGANPPSPLSANTFHQTLAWDGKDDLGNTVTVPSNRLSVRVRAGLGVSLDRFVGGNPYAFNGPFNGMSEGGNGEVYVWAGSEERGSAAARAFDANGNYLRTIFPIPAGKTLAQVSGFGVNNWLNGKYSPKVAQLADPSLGSLLGTTAGFAVAGGYTLLPLNNAGELWVGGGTGLLIQKFNSDGTCPSGSAPVNLITSPALGYYRNVFGPIYLCRANNPNYLYLSGYELAAQIDGGCHFVSAADTGFWRDGCVFKINQQTGVATQFITLSGVLLTEAARQPVIGNGDGYAAIHGVYADHSGHVFICDRQNKRIGVYDTTGVFVRSIDNIPFPDRVFVDEATGGVYVLCHSGENGNAGAVILRKYSGWDASATLLYSNSLWSSTALGPCCLIFRLGSDGKPRIWAGNSEDIRIYQESGNAVTLVKDFNAVKEPTVTFDRTGVDRKSETLFITNSFVLSGLGGLFQISDWTNPKLEPCSTSSKGRLTAGDLNVGFDGRLYVRADIGGVYNGGFSGPIQRFTMDRYHAPVSFANTGNNSAIPSIYGRMGAGYGDKGLAVAPDGHIAFMQMHAFSQYYVDQVPAGGTAGSATTVVDMSQSKGQGCVRFDLKGNLYFGGLIRPSNHVIPGGFAADQAYLDGVGSVIKYAPGTTGVFDPTNSTSTNCARVYAEGLGGMSGKTPMTSTSEDCACRSPRFDVDLFGRLFIPNPITQKIAIVDNNDNPILQFGEYGNWDSQVKGAGNLVPTSDIPFVYPHAVAASDNYIYVNDLIGTRIARIQMTYALNNMPGMAVENGDVGGNPAGLTLRVFPNPFRSSTVLEFPSGASADKVVIFDLRGAQVAALAVNKGRAIFSGRDTYGHRLTPGIYVAAFKNGSETRSTRLVLVK